MRVFLAIELPKKAKEEIDKQLRDIRKEYPYFTWVPKDNYHLTLHFFGETSEKELKKIKEKLDLLLYDIPPFHLYAYETGLFIDTKILMYLSFARQKTLEEVEERVRRAFAPLRTKKFVPHITLARYKIPAKQQYLLLKKKAQKLNLESAFKIDKIYLFESDLSGKTPEYKRLASFTLS